MSKDMFSQLEIIFLKSEVYFIEVYKRFHVTSTILVYYLSTVQLHAVEL
jgi:hypothetical protein